MLLQPAKAVGDIDDIPMILVLQEVDHCDVPEPRTGHFGAAQRASFLPFEVLFSHVV